MTDRKRLWVLVLASGVGFALLGCAPGGDTAEPVPGGVEQATPAADQSKKIPYARVLLEPLEGSTTRAKGSFRPESDGISFQLSLVDAPPGLHAVHIHEFGDCSDPAGKSAGGHWNPTGAKHGKWGEGEFHLGDIGNVEVDEDGRGQLTLATVLWTVDGPEETNVVGRSIIIHSGADDFVTQPTGNAGGRIACGVIERKTLERMPKVRLEEEEEE